MGTKWKGLGVKAGTRQVGRAAIDRAAETGRVTLVPLNLPAGRLIVQTIRLVSLPSPTASFLPLRSLCSILILGLTRFHLIRDVSVGSGGFGPQLQFQELGSRFLTTRVPLQHLPPGRQIFNSGGCQICLALSLSANPRASSPKRERNSAWEGVDARVILGSGQSRRERFGATNPQPFALCPSPAISQGGLQTPASTSRLNFKPDPLSGQDFVA